MLEPVIDFSDAEQSVEDKYNEGYQTYELDYETGEISRKLITGIKAVEQFAYLALSTPRFEHAIYSDQFGSEVLALIKMKDEVTELYLRSELERVITEALIYDDRIDDVTNFKITFETDYAHVNFTIIAMGDMLEMQEVINLEI